MTNVDDESQKKYAAELILGTGDDDAAVLCPVVPSLKINLSLFYWKDLRTPLSQSLLQIGLSRAQCLLFTTFQCIGDTKVKRWFCISSSQASM